jgi:hypothetical protein
MGFAARLICALLLTLSFTCATSAEKPSPQVWFAPNLGSSDYANLFTQPDRWAESRALIDVFQFYTGNICVDNSKGCPRCNGNVIQKFREVDAFKKLTEWGIEIAMEGGALKAEGQRCRSELFFPAMVKAIKTVKDNGGQLKYLSLDEPLWAGLRTDLSPGCNLTIPQIVNEVKSYIDKVHETDPAVEVGIIEPYPALKVEDLRSYIQTLKSSQVPVAFFRLDIDAGILKPGWENELRSLKTLLRDFGIPLHLIYGSPTAETSAEFVTNGLVNTARYTHVLGIPQGMVFQSWALSEPGTPRIRQILPVNLPEEEVSMTNFLARGLATAQAASRDTVPVYRLYSGSQATHLYSHNAVEGGPAFKAEGVAFRFFKGGAPDRAQVYRCRTPQSSFLSTTQNCEGYTMEGPMGFVSTKSKDGLVRLYRCGGPNDMIVTTSANECGTANYGAALPFGYAKSAE